MDKSVISRVVTVAGGRFAPGHLGELTQQVPFEMVDAVLEQTCRVQRRVRELPARVVVYLLLAGCLFAELGYPQVWGRLTAGLERLPVAAPSGSAMTQARRRLGPGPLRELFFLLRGPSPAGTRWRGLLVCAVDGTIMTVADSQANLAVYARQRGGPTGGSSYPQLRLLALVACGTRTVIDAVFGPASSGERTYAADLVRSLRAGMLLLAGRNFGSGALAREIAATRADFLIRVRTGNGAPGLPVLERLPATRRVPVDRFRDRRHPHRSCARVQVCGLGPAGTAAVPIERNFGTESHARCLVWASQRDFRSGLRSAGGTPAI